MAAATETYRCVRIISIVAERRLLEWDWAVGGERNSERGQEDGIGRTVAEDLGAKMLSLVARRLSWPSCFPIARSQCGEGCSFDRSGRPVVLMGSLRGLYILPCHHRGSLWHLFDLDVYTGVVRAMRESWMWDTPVVATVSCGHDHRGMRISISSGLRLQARPQGHADIHIEWAVVCLMRDAPVVATVSCGHDHRGARISVSSGIWGILWDCPGHRYNIGWAYGIIIMWDILLGQDINCLSQYYWLSHGVRGT
ncbi:hypothetical protein BKA93DRAFT_753768 [Sparassis latifolia]